jgi:hypothetical protein
MSQGPIVNHRLRCIAMLPRLLLRATLTMVYGQLLFFAILVL